jgi:hypothetical protein
MRPLWFIICLELLTCCIANIYSPGHYNLFSKLGSTKKRIEIDNQNVEFYDDKAYGSWSDGSEDFDVQFGSDICIDEDEAASTLLQIVNHILGASDGVISVDEANCKMSMSSKTAVIELGCWPLGRRLFVMKLSNRLKKGSAIEDDDDGITVEVDHLSGKPSSASKITVAGNTLRTKTIINWKDGALKVTLKYAAKGVPANQAGRVLLALRNFWKSRLEQEIQVACARVAQQRKYSAAALKADKAKKAKELDRIIHPEKYKPISPSVRRVGAGDSGGSGSGRYTPSAACQARRQVSRGG